MSKEVLCIPYTFISAYLSLISSVPLNDLLHILYPLHSSQIFLRLWNISSANLRLRLLFSFHCFPGCLVFSLSVLWIHLYCFGVQSAFLGTVSEVHSPALPMLDAWLLAWLSRNHNSFDIWISITAFSFLAKSFCHSALILSTEDPVPFYLTLVSSPIKSPGLSQVSLHF